MTSKLRDQTEFQLNNTTRYKAVIIFNPLAGRGKTSLYAVKARKHLQHNGQHVEDIIATKYAGHAETVLANDWGEKVELIVLVGGDGTLRELVSGLRKSRSDVEIAFIPMGNANVVARELNIPLQPKLAIELATTGKAKKVDICVLKQGNEDDLVFLAMLEIGFGTKIVSLVDKLRNGTLKTLYRFWGDLVYAIAGLMALRTVKRSTFSTMVDGISSTPLATHCVIANMQTYAKGWSLTPDALHDDGLLDTAISQRDDTWSTVRTFIAASKKRKLKSSVMTYQQAKNIEIVSESPLFVQIDGDPISLANKASISIDKEAFSIWVKQA